MIRAGLLNRIISVVSVTYTADGIGASTEQKSVKYGSVRASVKNQRGARQLESNITVYSYLYTVTIRKQYDINELDIIMINDQEYRILSTDKVTDPSSIIIEIEKIV